jgi:hypothetical protein
VTAPKANLDRETPDLPPELRRRDWRHRCEAVLSQPSVLIGSVLAENQHLSVMMFHQEC